MNALKIKRSLDLCRQRPKPSPEQRPCNLCQESFTPHTVFDRYCRKCKIESEILKFSEWLPEIDEALTERFSA